MHVEGEELGAGDLPSILPWYSSFLLALPLLQLLSSLLGVTTCWRSSWTHLLGMLVEVCMKRCTRIACVWRGAVGNLPSVWFGKYSSCSG